MLTGCSLMINYHNIRKPPTKGACHIATHTTALASSRRPELFPLTTEFSMRNYTWHSLMMLDAIKSGMRPLTLAELYERFILPLLHLRVW